MHYDCPNRAVIGHELSPTSRMKAGHKRCYGVTLEVGGCEAGGMEEKRDKSRNTEGVEAMYKAKHIQEHNQENRKAIYKGEANKRQESAGLEDSALTYSPHSFPVGY